MKMLKNTRKNRLIKKLSNDNVRKDREIKRLSGLVDLFQQESFQWEDLKNELLDYKYRYYILIERLEISDEFAKKGIKMIIKHDES